MRRGGHLLGPLLSRGPNGLCRNTTKGQISLQWDLPSNLCTPSTCGAAWSLRYQPEKNLAPFLGSKSLCLLKNNIKIELHFDGLLSKVVSIYIRDVRLLYTGTKIGGFTGGPPHAAAAGTDNYCGGHTSAMWNKLIG